MEGIIKKKNYYWLAAGVVNLLTAFIHTFGGQMDLVNPLLKSNLTETFLLKVQKRIQLNGKTWDAENKVNRICCSPKIGQVIKVKE